MASSNSFSFITKQMFPFWNLFCVVVDCSSHLQLFQLLLQMFQHLLLTSQHLLGGCFPFFMPFFFFFLEVS